MYLKEYLEQFGDKKIKVFVDMDGTIVDYVVGDTTNFDGRRPLMHNIKNLENVYNNMPNVEFYILSAARLHSGLEQKLNWLEKYTPFIKKENRIILIREDNDFKLSKELKAAYLEKFKNDDSIIIVVDDDRQVIDEIKEKNPNVIVLKDTALVD